MRRYYFKKGKHDASPITWPRFHRSPKGFTVTVQPNPTAAYSILPDVDQWDINKLFGLAYSWTSNKYNTVYTGYRPNPDTGKFEVFGYLNDRGGIKNTRPFEMDYDEVCTIHVRLWNGLVAYHFTFTKGTTIRQYVANIECSFPLDGIARTVGMWHGGTKPAPKNYHLDVGFSVW